MFSEEYIDSKLNMMLSDGVDEYVVAGVALMFQVGCRVSSILHICPGDVSPQGRIYLWQGKGSAPLVVMPCKYKELFLSIRTMQYSPFSFHNYMYYYRLLKRYALCGEDMFGTKGAVTATARKQVAKDMYTQNDGLEKAATALGHHRTTSTEYYVKEKHDHIKQVQGVLKNPSGIVENIVVCKNGVLRIKKNL